MGKSKMVIYKAKGGRPALAIKTEGGTVLLTQQQVTLIFNVQKAAISKHVNNIFASRELSRAGTVSKMETVQNEGRRKIIRKIEYYNLDLVLFIIFITKKVKRKLTIML